MRRPSFLAVCLVLTLTSAACSPRFGAGDAGAGAGEDGVDAGLDARTKVTGAACGQVAPQDAPGVVLCRAISLCPSLVIDSELFPNCGFRVRGEAIDLECWCDRALCPMGVPTTCDEAARLLASQSEIQVCLQEYEGRCVSR